MIYDLDENGNVKKTFSDAMRVLGNKSYKIKIKEPKEPFIPKKGVLFVDILEGGCYDCPCCDNEQCYCTVLPDRPEVFSDRLTNCPIKEISITPEVFAERMRGALDEGAEDGHRIMDNLMCELLRELGYGEGIDILRVLTNGMCKKGESDV